MYRRKSSSMNRFRDDVGSVIASGDGAATEMHDRYSRLASERIH